MTAEGEVRCATCGGALAPGDGEDCASCTVMWTRVSAAREAVQDAVAHGDLDGALRLLDEQLAALEGDARLASLAAELRPYRAEVLSRAGDHARAAEAYRALLGDVRFAEAELDLRAALANELLLGGHKAEAIAELRACLATAGTTLQSIWHLFDMLVKAGGPTAEYDWLVKRAIVQYGIPGLDLLPAAERMAAGVEAYAEARQRYRALTELVAEARAGGPHTVERLVEAYELEEPVDHFRRMARQIYGQAPAGPLKS